MDFQHLKIIVLIENLKNLDLLHKNINEELRDILKMNRKGLQNYKKTLGTKSVQRGRPKGTKPRPNPFIGLNQTEI